MCADVCPSQNPLIMPILSMIICAGQCIHIRHATICSAVCRRGNCTWIKFPCMLIRSMSCVLSCAFVCVCADVRPYQQSLILSDVAHLIPGNATNVPVPASAGAAAATAGWAMAIWQRFSGYWCCHDIAWLNNCNVGEIYSKIEQDLEGGRGRRRRRSKQQW